MISSAFVDRSSNPHIIGPAIPVEVMTASQAASMPIAGKPMRVVRATNANIAAGRYKVTGQRPIPIVVTDEPLDSVGMPVQPVYVTSGILDILEYTNKIIALGPIAYWPQAEPSGSTATDESGNSRNGTYTAVTLAQTGIGDGRTAASFNGATSKNNIYTAGLAGAFNGQEGTMAVWLQVTSAGVWTDGVNRRLFHLTVDGSNDIVIRRGANLIVTSYLAGGTTKTIQTAASALTWLHAAITWSKSADQYKFYLNGVLINTLTSLGTFAGALLSTGCVIGASDTTPTNVWSGNIAHAAIFARALTAAEILSAATVYVP